MARETIKDYLVSIGFDIDSTGAQQVESYIKAIGNALRDGVAMIRDYISELKGSSDAAQESAEAAQQAATSTDELSAAQRDNAEASAQVAEQSSQAAAEVDKLADKTQKAAQTANRAGGVFKRFNIIARLRGAREGAKNAHQLGDAVKESGERLKAAISAIAAIIAAAGITQLIGSAIALNDTLDQTARQLGVSREEARAYNMALAAMGKTADEIAQDDALKQTFEELKAIGMRLALPEAAVGVNMIGRLKDGFMQLKLTANYALQWLIYKVQTVAEGPLNEVFELMRSLREWLGSNIESIAGTMARVIGGIVQIFASVTTAIKGIIGWIQQLPPEVKAAGAIIIAVIAAIKSKTALITMVIGAILLLIDDFVTYMQGGDSLFGGFWGTLLDWVEKVRPYVEQFINYFSTGFSTVLEWMQSLCEWLGDSGVAALGALAAAIGVVTIAMNANPIGLIITSVVALIALIGVLKKHWGAICEWFSSYAQGIADAWNQMIADIVAWFTSAGQSITDAFSGMDAFFAGIWASIVTLFSGIGEWFSNLFTSAYTGITTAFANVGTFFSDAWTSITSAFSTAATWASGVGTSILTGITTGFDAIGTWFTTNVVTPVKTAFDDIGDFFSGIAANIWSGLTGGLSSGLESAKESVVGYFSSLWQGVLDFFGIASPSTLAATDGGYVVEGFTQGAEGQQESAGARLKSVFSGIYDAAKGIWDGVTSWFSSLFGGGSEDDATAAAAENEASETASNIASSVETAFSGIDTSISGPIATGSADAATAFASLETTATTVASNIEATITTLNAKIATVSVIVKTMTTAVKNELKTLPTTVSQIFAATASAMVSKFTAASVAIRSQIASIKTALSSIPTNIRVGVSGATGYSVGGVVTRPTRAVIGEEGRKEYVIPVTKPGRALPLLRSAAADLGMTVSSVNHASRMLGGASNTGATPVYGTGAAPRAGGNNTQISAPATIHVYGSNAHAIAQNVAQTQERLIVRNLKSALA